MKLADSPMIRQRGPQKRALSMNATPANNIIKSDNDKLASSMFDAVRRLLVLKKEHGNDDGSDKEI